MTLSRRRFLRVGGSAAVAASIGCDDMPEVLRTWALGDRAPDGPFRQPQSADVDAISHVLNRLTFGQRPGDYERVRELGASTDRAVRTFIDEQLVPESIEDDVADRAVRRLESIGAAPGELFEYREEFLLAEMTRAAVLRATLSRRQLYEVMVHFWSDHFNIDRSKGDCRWLKAADDRLVIRPHALGRFPELLRASAKSSAMLWYLDGRQNRRADAMPPAGTGGLAGPNENYARELLELHTLGVEGGYTQRDVMEVARALTGWTVRGRGESVFRLGEVEFHADRHDDGEKVVLGHRIAAGNGAKDLDRVLDVVALHPATARHIGTKLCRRFIADEPPTEAIDAVASMFARSGGDIGPTLRVLFETPAFWAARAEKLKRPFHFVVSALRATEARTDGGEAVTDYLVRMGHAPYQYPTPDGYPDEASPWLGTLLWRWNFAVALAGNRLEGTRVDGPALAQRLGGDAGLAAHLLGRRPTDEEVASYHASKAGLALLLASPGFQRC